MRIKIEEYHWDTFQGHWEKRFESDWIEIEEGRISYFWDQFVNTSEKRFELVKEKDYMEELEAAYE